MFNVAIGLFLCILSNLLFGITIAKIKGAFDKNKMLKSFIKYISMIIGIIFLYIAGALNEDIIITNIDNCEVNILLGIKAIFTLGIIYYGGQSFIKLKKLLGIKIGNKL